MKVISMTCYYACQKLLYQGNFSIIKHYRGAGGNILCPSFMREEEVWGQG